MCRGMRRRKNAANPAHPIQQLIYLRRNGGSDHQIAPSKRVNIHTKKGMVKAVFGWPAIHTRTAANEKTPKLDNIFLDKEM